ncbi:unnamed protein product [Effrenium voratum]|uniref:Uncharacterized protein n=1 Tax=Effrenium voratum TaxID=2562239 RepID=A0AA36I1R2_9DINO|nr:unnamed protein product [Effrenium voratum]
MPFDTVDEQYTRQRKVLVCERCRRPMQGVQHRQAYQTGGSIAGSLGGSVGGSMLAGAVLGPVGALAGAIGGAIAGSRAGAVASEGVCDVVDSTGSQICDACKEAASVRPAGYQNWGGGRLGADSSEPQAAPAATATAEPTVTDRLSDTATSAGKHLGEAASAVGDGLSSVGSWVRKSVSSATGSEEPKKEKAEAFKPFAGAGQPLVPAPSAADRAAARAAAAEAAMRRSGQAPAGSSGARGSAPGQAGSSAARQAGTAA